MLSVGGRRKETLGTGLKAVLGGGARMGRIALRAQPESFRVCPRLQQQIAHRIMQSQLQGARPGHANQGIAATQCAQQLSPRSSEPQHLSAPSIVVFAMAQLHPGRGTVGRISAWSSPAPVLSCDSSTRTAVAVDSLCTENCIQGAECSVLVQYSVQGSLDGCTALLCYVQYMYCLPA